MNERENLYVPSKASDPSPPAWIGWDQAQQKISRVYKINKKIYKK